MHPKAARAAERAAAFSAPAQMGLAALGGLVAALGLAPFGLWPLGLLGFAAALFMVRAASSCRRAALLGWAAGLGYFALALMWLVEPFLVDIKTHGWMAPFALFFMCAGLSLFWGTAAALAHGRSAPALVGALALAEMARTYLLTGFPWALIGYLWSESPAALHAAWIGSHGLTLAALGAALALAGLIGPQRRSALATLAAIALAALAAPLLHRSAETAPDAPILRLVQPNAEQHLKWDPAMVPVFFERQLGFTAAPSETGQRPDIIIWPETSLAWTLGRAGRALELVSEAAGDVPVVLGVQRFEGRALFNSALLLGADGTQAALYDKHHLVPFGEYIPFGSVLAGLAPAGLAQRFEVGYSPGPGPELMELPGIGPTLPLICYEAVFPHDVAAAPKRPALLMQLTNDAWFGKFSGPYQHLSQARMRAIEQGLPMVRAANTGVSAVISARGEVLASLGLGEAGFVDAPLPAALPPTLYARTGDWPALLVALFLLALGWRRPQNTGKH